jgi:hypothetical protein
MKWPTLKCPFCGSILPNRQYKAGTPSICPGCSERLRLARWYLHLTSASALALTLVVCFLFGLRGLWLIVATVLLWFPIDVVWNHFFARVFPPRFERHPPDDSGTKPSANLFLR